jgi:hypothetical protein
MVPGKEEDTNILTMLAFWAFADFWGPTPKQPNTVFMGKTQILLWGNLSFWEAPKLKFYSGDFCPFWVPTVAF